MTISQSWAFQQAVYDRLTAQLVGQGPGGSNVTVYDHVPEDPARVHCRVDSFNVVRRQIKADKTQHFFTVHIFDRPMEGSTAARGQRTAKELQETVVAALHGWTPSVTGASAIRHEESDMAPDEDGLTQHAFSRFYAHIAPS